MPLAPGSPPTGGYVDTSITVPAEGSYEEEWEVFDPWVHLYWMSHISWIDIIDIIVLFIIVILTYI